MRTQQHPIGSGHRPASTAEEVIAGIDLSGKTGIMTGGYSGRLADPNAQRLVFFKSARRRVRSFGGLRTAK